MKKVLHKANSREYAYHGWLNASHTFNNAGYYNPDRLHFGALVGLDDEVIAGGINLGNVAHDNVEIISIPITGGLGHTDNMGNESSVKSGGVQVISCGTGVTHSEFNLDQNESSNFLQICISPRTNNLQPHFDQRNFAQELENNQWVTMISPDTNPVDGALWVHQDAYCCRGQFKAGNTIEYTVRANRHGVYLFVINGSISIDNTQLNTRDGIGIWETGSIGIDINKDCDLLAIEVPMVGA